MTCAGRLMQNTAHAATSSARIIRARAAASGTTGRFSSNGVSMSPGKIAHARMPLARSSALMLWVNPASVDDRAAAAGAHLRQERLHTVVGAVEIGGDHRVIILHRQHVECPLRRVRAGGIHQDLDVAPRREHVPAHRRDRVSIADVTDVRRDAWGMRPAARGRLAKRVRPAPDDRDAPALLDECQGDGLAHAAAAARDDRCPGHALCHLTSVRAPSWKLGTHGRCSRIASTNSHA